LGAPTRDFCAVAREKGVDEARREANARRAKRNARKKARKEQRAAPRPVEEEPLGVADLLAPSMLAMLLDDSEWNEPASANQQALVELEKQIAEEAAGNG